MEILDYNFKCKIAKKLNMEKRELCAPMQVFNDKALGC